METEVIKAAVRRFNPQSEADRVYLPHGEWVPFSRIIALTNGEALEWLFGEDENPLTAAFNLSPEELSEKAKAQARDDEGQFVEEPDVKATLPEPEEVTPPPPPEAEVRSLAGQEAIDALIAAGYNPGSAQMLADHRVYTTDGRSFTVAATPKSKAATSLAKAKKENERAQVPRRNLAGEVSSEWAERAAKAQAKEDAAQRKYDRASANPSAKDDAMAREALGFLDKAVGKLSEQVQHREDGRRRPFVAILDWSLTPKRGVSGAAYRGANTMWINPKYFDDPVSTSGYFADAPEFEKAGEHTVNHELGHLLDVGGDMQVYNEAWNRARDRGEVSQYGHKNAAEGYAEVFAAWQGGVRNETTLEYARLFGWEQEEATPPPPPTSSEPAAPDLSDPAGVQEYELTAEDEALEQQWMDVALSGTGRLRELPLEERAAYKRLVARRLEGRMRDIPTSAKVATLSQYFTSGRGTGASVAYAGDVPDEPPSNPTALIGDAAYDYAIDPRTGRLLLLDGWDGESTVRYWDPTAWDWEAEREGNWVTFDPRGADSARGGTPEADVLIGRWAAGGLVKAWADSSNDNHVGSLTTQEAVRQQFGLETASDWSSPVAPLPLEGDVGLVVNRFVHAMHAETQDLFARHGITEMVLFRGAVADSDQQLAGMVEDVRAFKALQRQVVTSGESANMSGVAFTRPASSWASSQEVAKSFAEGDQRNPFLVRSTFPVDRILATPLTGFGCSDEWEFIPLGEAGAARIAPRRQGDFLTDLFATEPIADVGDLHLDPDDTNADWIKQVGDWYEEETGEPYQPSPDPHVPKRPGEYNASDLKPGDTVRLMGARRVVANVANQGERVRIGTFEEGHEGGEQETGFLLFWDDTVEVLAEEEATPPPPTEEATPPPPPEPARREWERPTMDNKPADALHYGTAERRVWNASEGEWEIVDGAPEGEWAAPAGDLLPGERIEDRAGNEYEVDSIVTQDGRTRVFGMPVAVWRRDRRTGEYSWRRGDVGLIDEVDTDAPIQLREPLPVVPMGSDPNAPRELTGQEAVDALVAAGYDPALAERLTDHAVLTRDGRSFVVVDTPKSVAKRSLDRAERALVEARERAGNSPAKQRTYERAQAKRDEAQAEYDNAVTWADVDWERWGKEGLGHLEKAVAKLPKRLAKRGEQDRPFVLVLDQFQHEDLRSRRVDAVAYPGGDTIWARARYSRGSPGEFMGAFSSSFEHTVNHELGHLVEPYNPEQVTQTFREALEYQITVPGDPERGIRDEVIPMLGEYARSSPHEAYAEAFAAWQAGNRDAYYWPVVMLYAERFGWDGSLDDSDAPFHETPRTLAAPRKPASPQARRVSDKLFGKQATDEAEWAVDARYSQYEDGGAAPGARYTEKGPGPISDTNVPVEWRMAEDGQWRNEAGEAAEDQEKIEQAWRDRSAGNPTEPGKPYPERFRRTPVSRDADPDITEHERKKVREAQQGTPIIPIEPATLRVLMSTGRTRRSSGWIKFDPGQRVRGPNPPKQPRNLPGTVQVQLRPEHRERMSVTFGEPRRLKPLWLDELDSATDEQLRAAMGFNAGDAQVEVQGGIGLGDIERITMSSRDAREMGPEGLAFLRRLGIKVSIRG